VRRPRLTERLAAGLRGPLTLVVAPAGWGKTTLLGEWRAAGHEPPWPVAWLALDAGDNDAARWLRYAVAALQTLRPALGAAVLAGLRSPQPPPVEALLTLLVNDLAALPADVVLVLDDYQAIEAPVVHRAVAFLLDHLPPRAHLVIAARADPPLPLARLRARGQLTELRADDLRFGAGEVAEFLGRTMGLRLAADDVARLEACTEGWIAGLQLAALSLRGRAPGHLSDAVAALTAPPRYVVDYLTDEVFQGQPEDVRRFLLRTSILERLCVELGARRRFGAEQVGVQDVRDGLGRPVPVRRGSAVGLLEGPGPAAPVVGDQAGEAVGELVDVRAGGRVELGEVGTERLPRGVRVVGVRHSRVSSSTGGGLRLADRPGRGRPRRGRPGRAGAAQCQVTPPSTARSWPVIQAPISLHR
jgi:hypothetical protein